MINGGIPGEKVWEGDTETGSLSPLAFSLFFFFSVLPPLGFWGLRRYRCFMYTRFSMRFRLSGLYFS
jgi:hypothetical protein